MALRRDNWRKDNWRKDSTAPAGGHPSRRAAIAYGEQQTL
jgi:hypothetical protein